MAAGVDTGEIFLKGGDWIEIGDGGEGVRTSCRRLLHY